MCKHGMVHVPNTMQCYSTMLRGCCIVVRSLQQLHKHEFCIGLCIYSAITSHAVIFSLVHDMSMLEGGDCTCMQALPQAFVFGHHLLEGHAAC